MAILRDGVWGSPLAVRPASSGRPRQRAPPTRARLRQCAAAGSSCLAGLTRDASVRPCRLHGCTRRHRHGPPARSCRRRRYGRSPTRTPAMPRPSISRARRAARADLDALADGGSERLRISGARHAIHRRGSIEVLAADDEEAPPRCCAPCSARHPEGAEGGGRVAHRRAAVGGDVAGRRRSSSCGPGRAVHEWRHRPIQADLPGGAYVGGLHVYRRLCVADIASEEEELHMASSRARAGRVAVVTGGETGDRQAVALRCERGLRVADRRRRRRRGESAHE